MRRLAMGTLFAVPLLFPPVGAGDGPAKAGPFLAWCQTNSGACSDRIASVEVSLANGKDKRYCAPKEGDDASRAAKVQAWLAEHPEENGRATDDAIADGWIALYPCGV